MLIDPLLLTTTRILTRTDRGPLTNATGFFFRRGQQLFLVTSRHVLIDEPSGHHPTAVDIELHPEPENLAEILRLRLDLYSNGRACWRQARDGGGEVDVAVLPVDPGRIPQGAALQSFTPQHLPDQQVLIGMDTTLLVAGFPLDFHDTLHHAPVVRRAGLASAFGLRFQGHGYFLTDARTHRGTSGAPVVMRTPDSAVTDPQLPWTLLGIHSARLDSGSRDRLKDEALGLNCAWYADVLMTLTQAP